jgi:enoyl-CoA hydratase/carnithine racemase
MNLFALEDETPAVLLVLGTPGDFLAGADLRELLEITEANAPLKAMDYARAGLKLLRRLQALPAFTIAFIDGHCLGGGLDLALHCDARWVSARATLGHPGINKEFFTGWGGTELLADFPGGKEMLLSGEIIDGAAALKLGIATQLLEDEPAALALAAKSAEGLAAISAEKRKLLKEGWLRAKRMSAMRGQRLLRRLEELGNC